MVSSRLRLKSKICIHRRLSKKKALRQLFLCPFPSLSCKYRIFCTSLPSYWSPKRLEISLALQNLHISQMAEKQTAKQQANLNLLFHSWSPSLFTRNCSLHRYLRRLRLRFQEPQRRNTSSIPRLHGWHQFSWTQSRLSSKLQWNKLKSWISPLPSLSLC